jgi:hypothetical protein
LAAGWSCGSQGQQRRENRCAELHATARGLHGPGFRSALARAGSPLLRIVRRHLIHVQNRQVNFAKTLRLINVVAALPVESTNSS